jgi:hypothetical protein
MSRFLQPLLLLLGRLTERQLAEVVQYPNAENELLRGWLPGRVTVTPLEEQWLHRFGRPVGARIKDFGSIVTPWRRLRSLNGVPVWNCPSAGPAEIGRMERSPPKAASARHLATFALIFHRKSIAQFCLESISEIVKTLPRRAPEMTRVAP